jgi:crossover junction endodeoxyribonuclease RusA
VTAAVAPDWWPQPPSASDIYVQVTLDIEPVSKSRARISAAEYTQIEGLRVKTKNAHGYSTQALRAYQEHIGWLLRQARVSRNDVDDLGVHAVFYVRGNQRRDLDNLVKSLLDGCNGVAWRDDMQVTRITSEIVRSSDHPHIDLIIYVTKRRGRECGRCGSALSNTQITQGAVFCSKKCYDTDQRRGAYRACTVCGTSVYRQAGKAKAKETYCSPTCRAAGRGVCRQCSAPNDKAWSGRRFCSTECSVTWHKTRQLAVTTRPSGTCTDCGGATFSVGSKRCRGCHIANVSRNGQNSKRRPAYDACPDCGGRKRVTAIRCMSCFKAAMNAGLAGRWKVA